MSNSNTKLGTNIGLKLYKFQSSSNKKILNYKTNPIIIYLCKIMVYDILKPIDYLILNPIIISSILIIFCIDNVEIWSRFSLRIVIFYSFFLRKLIECISYFHNILSTKVDDWRQQNNYQMLLRNMENINFNNTYLKCKSCMLQIFNLFIDIQLYVRIPILLLMNKINAFTIRIQQSEIYLLRRKSHYLNEKNQWLTHYVSTMHKRRIYEYNMKLCRKLKKYLKKILPIELIQEIYQFSRMLLSNDK
eukprot:UN03433